MIRRFAALLALCGLATAGAAQTAPAPILDPAQIGALAENRGFSGVILISRGDTIIYERAFGNVRPGDGEPHNLDARWRWASITKQIVATIVMQEAAAGRIDLDAPIGRYWPDFITPYSDRITARHLLGHLSGLPDPENTPRLPTGLPAFYSGDISAEGYCMGPPLAAPGTAYRYNNCDYIVLGKILERVSGQSLGALIEARIPGGAQLFPDGAETVPGFHFGQAEPPIPFAVYGAAGGMNGTLHDLWRFDRALMTGTLIPDDARELMWTGDPAIGYAALGQWVFDAPLSGCASPQRLVERHGAIGGVQGRNFILPDRDIVVIAFTNRSEGEFDFGQIWRGEGFAYDLLMRAVCSGLSE
ncbi:beta-lactamase family protein [Parasphingopyxis algicola]|uniref:serine hydrolase domain-containing protein n=1 Tax=Parasphingopyxis algicola TaxID=2026624 RepID=UPI00159FAE29|nr:serine hydrolase domain-containing protein [Parasphingopyxis algicola]QLC25251.1 beta-lactamase family protein [Parasphingopyxis algicola]